MTTFMNNISKNRTWELASRNNIFTIFPDSLLDFIYAVYIEMDSETRVLRVLSVPAEESTGQRVRTPQGLHPAAKASILILFLTEEMNQALGDSEYPQTPKPQVRCLPYLFNSFREHHY